MTSVYDNMTTLVIKINPVLHSWDLGAPQSAQDND